MYYIVKSAYKIEYFLVKIIYFESKIEYFVIGIQNLKQGLPSAIIISND